MTPEMNGSGHDGLILFAHGARDPLWARPFEVVAERVRAARPGLPVRLAFLEFMAPTLPEAGAALAQGGCRHVAVRPLFLGAGGHVRRDLPLLLESMRTAHPDTRFELQDVVGEADSVIDAMAAVAAASLEDRR